MRSGASTGLFLIAAAVVAWGCSGGSKDDGVKPENQKILSDVNSLAKSVGGDYNKLTPDQKQQFLKIANGNEAQAKSICNMMVHSPNEGMTQGRPAGPPKK